MQVETMNALIGAVGEVLAAVIAGVAVFFAAKRVVTLKKLRSDLIVALNDLSFMLKVEKAHVSVFVAQNGKDNKVMIRDVIRDETDQDLSGKNTLSQIKRKLMRLDAYDE